MFLKKKLIFKKLILMLLNSSIIFFFNNYKLKSTILTNDLRIEKLWGWPALYGIYDLYAYLDVK